MLTETAYVTLDDAQLFTKAWIVRPTHVILVNMVAFGCSHRAPYFHSRI